MGAFRVLNFYKLTFLILLFATTTVAYQNCGQFQSGRAVTGESFLQIGEAELIQKGQGLYEQSCAQCHGPIDSSAKIGRTSEQIKIAIDNVPQMEFLSAMPTEDIEAIGAALVFQAGGGGLVINTQGRLEYQCEAGLNPKTPMTKLTNREFRNSLNSLLDSFATNLKQDNRLQILFDQLPNDTIANSHGNLVEQSRLVTQLSNRAFFETAFRAAELVASSTGLNSYPGTNGCLAGANINQNCHRSFVQQLGEVAFRNQLTTSELSQLADSLWINSSKIDQIIFSVTSLLQMPEFIYKSYDQGVANPNKATLVELTAHELAAKVSFLLTGDLPDSTLRALADSGQIFQPTILEQQVERLLGVNQTQDMIVRLFRESYGYDVFEDFNYTSSYLGNINSNGLPEAMTRELDDFFITEILQNRSSFSEIMTSRYSRIDDIDLARVYGLNATGTHTLPETRQGFLNRAAMLAKRSGYSTSPIKRGLSVLQNVLCIDVGEPPPDAPTSLPETDPNEILSTRDKTAHTSEAAGTACIVCHSRINPLGYPFENFDSLGRERQFETVYDSIGDVLTELNIDTEAVTKDIGLETSTIADSVDLSQQLANSDKAALCLAKHIKRFESRQPTSIADHCQMNEILDAVYGENNNQGSIADALKKLILSEQFRYWNFEE